jgi:6-phosphogluconolactonase
MKKAMGYIGSYSLASGEGIYTFELDQITGQLSMVFEPVCIENPSYIRLSDDERFLYAVMETRKFGDVSSGGVAAYRIDDKGGLTFLNATPTMGLDPCYLSTDKGNSVLVAANYSSGSLSTFSLDPNGSIEPCSAVETHQGSGPNQDRQAAPHVHCTDFTPNGDYICAVDLGIDAVKFYRFNKGVLHAEDRFTVKLRPGSGPRHIVFRKQGQFFYIIHELSSEIAVFQKIEGQYRLIQCLSTLPTDFKGKNFSAALHSSPNGRFMYASNRGHDSIAAYQIDDGGVLTLCGIYSVQGHGPRDFAIEPNGNYLLAANEKSNEVVALKIDSDSGALIPTGSRIELHSPTCIQFRSI